jgi:hypothetical protein
MRQGHFIGPAAPLGNELPGLVIDIFWLLRFLGRENLMRWFDKLKLDSKLNLILSILLVCLFLLVSFIY